MAGQPRRLSRVGLLAVILVAFVAGANTLTHELVYDDLALIPHREAVRDPLDVVGIATTTYWGSGDDLYRPLTLWTLALNHGANRLAGLPGPHPVGYHVINVLLHVCVSCALCSWLHRLRFHPWCSVAAAALFAAHPLHTEAIAQIVGRSELLAALFGLLFLLAHRAGRRVPVGAVFYFLALSSKESAAVFLPLAYWTDRVLPRPGGRPGWRALASYVAALGGWLALRATALPASAPGIPFVDNPLAHASTLERWMTALRVQLDYLRLQLLPLDLSADYSFDQIPVISGALDPRPLLLVAIASTAALVGWRLRRSHPVVLFAVGGYALLFAPASNLLFAIGTIMGERLAYAPSMMSCLVVGYAAWQARERFGRVMTIAVATVVLVLAGMALQRNTAWRNEEVHLRALVRSAPRNVKAHYHLARHLNDSGRPAPAVAAAREAISILPTYAEAWHELGRARAAQGDGASAIEAYREAVRIHPGYAEAWGGLGIALAESGAHEEAAAAFLRALEIEPGRASFHYGRGLALQWSGRTAEASEAYREALRIDHAHASALTNLGSILAGEGRLAEAEAHWRQALEADPSHAGARENLERLRRTWPGGDRRGTGAE